MLTRFYYSRSPDDDDRWYSTWDFSECLLGGDNEDACDISDSPVPKGTKGDLKACLFGGDEDTCDFTPDMHEVLYVSHSLSIDCDDPGLRNAVQL